MKNEKDVQKKILQKYFPDTDETSTAISELVPK